MLHKLPLINKASLSLFEGRCRLLPLRLWFMVRILLSVIYRPRWHRQTTPPPPPVADRTDLYLLIQSDSLLGSNRIRLLILLLLLPKTKGKKDSSSSSWKRLCGLSASRFLLVNQSIRDVSLFSPLEPEPFLSFFLSCQRLNSTYNPLGRSWCVTNLKRVLFLSICESYAPSVDRLAQEIEGMPNVPWRS